MAGLWVTAAGAVVETDPGQEIQATAAGTLVEITEIPRVQVTAAGILVELTYVGSTGPVPAAGNVSISLGGFDLAPYADKASLTAQIRAWECTTQASTAKESIPTTTLWAFPVGGHWDPALDSRLGPWALRGEQKALVITLGDVTYSWAKGQLVDYTVTSEAPKEGIVWMASLSGVGVPARS